MSEESEPSDAMIRQVMGMIGRRKTEKKSEAARENVAKARTRLQDADVRALLSTKQQERRARERTERQGSDLEAAPVEKRAPGRPRTQPLIEATGEKRGRGRPKAQKGNAAQ